MITFCSSQCKSFTNSSSNRSSINENMYDQHHLITFENQPSLEVQRVQTLQTFDHHDSNQLNGLTNQQLNHLIAVYLQNVWEIIIKKELVNHQAEQLDYLKSWKTKEIRKEKIQAKDKRTLKMKTVNQQNHHTQAKIKNGYANTFGNIDLFKEHQSKLEKQSRATLRHAEHTTKNSRLDQDRKVKQNNIYDQLEDRTLVQYFYTKQKSIFNQSHQLGVQGHTNITRKIKNKQNQNVKLHSKSRKLEFHLNCSKSFEVINDIGRRANFNEYDLISFQSSIRKDKNQKSMIKEIRKTQQLHQTRPRLLLRSRMNDLQTQVTRRVPFLVQMGVRFKKIKGKK